EYSEEFLLWCRKLQGLSDEEYRRGFYQLEYKVRESARQGEEEWPCSYAGFIGHCSLPHGQRAHRRFQQPRLPDKTAQERAAAAGAAELDKMRSLFSDK